MTLKDFVNSVEGVHNYKFICGEQTISINRFGKVLKIANEYKYSPIEASLEVSGYDIIALIDMGFEDDFEREDFLDLISE